MGFPNFILLSNTLKVANAPKNIPAKRNAKLEIATRWFGPLKGGFPRICDTKNPRPRTSEPVPRATRLKEPLDKKPRAKKYATTNALMDKNNECAKENGAGSSKIKVLGRFCSG